MTLSNIVGLFAGMVILAAIPSLSVFTVIARAISHGFTTGFITAIGIVTGDIIFILIAIYGLSAMAETTMNNLINLIQALGGIYLIWLGINLCLTKSSLIEIKEVKRSSILSSFLSGLFITLSDQKAILFYISFFPAFINLNSLTVIDASLIILITIFAVGGVKAGYAYMANKARLILENSKTRQIINLIAAVFMIAVGIFLITKT